MPKSRKDIFHLNAGEWAQEVYGREDHEKHASACRQAKNVISTAQGSVTKRKGFELVAPAKYDAKRCNIIRFRFSKDDTTCLEIGHEYIRFHTNGQQVREAGITVDSITAANPAVVTATAHGYSNGDEIYLDDLTEMPEMNGRWLLVANKNTDDFELTDRDGNVIDSSTWTAETTGGTSEKVYEIASVFTEDDLSNLDYAQKNDVLWLVDGAHPVQQLIRYASTSWSVGEFAFVTPPVLDANTEAGDFLALSATTGTGVTMTATGHAPFEDGHIGSYWILRHLRPSSEITTSGVTAAIEVLGDATFETSGKWTGTVDVYKSIVANPNLSVLDSTEWTNVGSYTSNDGAGGDGKNFNVRFTQEDESRYYYISGSVAGAKATLRSEAALIEGAVQITAKTSTSIVTVDVIKDVHSTDVTEDWSEGAWSEVQGFPAAIALFEKAIWFARTDAYPQGIWKSETDLYDSFKLGQDDTDGLFLQLDSKERNDILWMVDQDKLMIGTSGSEWTLSGTDLNSIISPTNIVARRQENKGSKDVRPETVDDVIMYMQRGSSESLRAMSFSIERDKFHASNMQEFSGHLTASGVTSMAYQGAPDPVLWCCTGSGRLLSFTYERDQKVYAWNPHDTAGTFEDVETIYGSEDDEVWVSVNRLINGATRRFIERLTGYYNPQASSGVGLVAFIIDLSGSMQSIIDDAKEEAITLAISMSNRYSSSRFALYTIADAGNTIVQKADFTSVGEVISLISGLTEQSTSIEQGFEAIVQATNDLSWGDYDNADKHIIMLTNEVSGTSETQENANAAVLGIGAKLSFGTHSQSTGPQDYEPIRANSGGAWFGSMSDMTDVIEPILAEADGSSSEKAFSDSSLRLRIADAGVIHGLWHLEGEKVVALVDGYVVDDLIVADGSVAIDFPASLSHVGLQYEAIIQPMQLNADANSGASVGYEKVISSVYARLLNTIGLSYSDGSKFRPLSFREGNQDQALPPQLFSGDVELMMNTGHTEDPTIILKHSDPQPFTLAGLIIHYDITGN